MKKKYEFDNVFSLNVFDDIIGEVCVKCSNVKFEVNKEKFYYTIESNDESFSDDKQKVEDIVKYYIPNIELVEKEANKYIVAGYTIFPRLRECVSLSRSLKQATA